jgi:hypothetical protein
VKKIALAALLALATVPAASHAQVSINIAPPPVIVEHPGPPPERGSVWIGGYQRWDGARYVWSPGHFEHPPHPGAHWVAHRYVRHGNGWRFEEGHWR